MSYIPQTALESPANTAPAVLLDHGVRIVGGRSPAFWRGSSDLNVTVYPDRIVHHSGTYRVPRILTELLGYSEDEARRYLLERAGLSAADAPPVYRRFTAGTAPQKAPKETETPLKADGALKRWETLSTTGSSPYLERKGVQGVAAGCGAIRYGRGSIAVQMSRITEAGALEPVSVQTIYSGGEKRFAAGGSTRGAVALVGAADLAAALASGHVWLAEGLATALTVHEATGGPVLACFSAGTLRPALKALRRLGPNRKKLRLLIAADDDRFNKPEAGNAGLEKAHRAALVHGARVAAPTFRSLEGQPTDFNDLHALEGLGAVREQLAGARAPDPALAFAADRRKRDKHSGRRGASIGRYLPAQAFGPGATVLKAPHGTGKTEVTGAQVDAALGAGERVLYLTHSAALAETGARRLRLESYSDELHRRHLGAVPGLSICLNSLPRLQGNGVLAPFDLVVIDESEQLVRALKGSHIADRGAVLEVLLLLIGRAGRVVCLDADAGRLTRELLELARPRERVRWLEHDYPVGEGRTMRVHEMKNGVYGALEGVTAPAFVVTNSRHEAEALGAHLRARGRRVRVLTGEHTGDDAAFMTDLEDNARAEGLDALVCSPTVRTGVSLEGGYFGHVFGLFYGGVGTYEDALQALWRVRTPCTYDLWLDPAVRTERVDLAVKYAKLTPKSPTEAAYNRIRCAVELTEGRSQAFYRLDFLRLAALQGFSFELLEGDPAHKGLAKAARELATAEHYDRVEAEPLPSHDKARELRRRVDGGGHVSREDRAGLERYRVTDFYRLTAADDLRAALELDRRGRYQGQLERLELALDTPEGVLARELAEAQKRPLQADRRPLTAWHELQRRTVQAVGFGAAGGLVMGGNLEQLDLPRYGSEQLEPLRLWIEENRSWLAGAVALPDPARLKRNMIRYVGSWLKAFGLRQKRVGDSHARTYALEVKALKTACETLKRRHTLFSRGTSLEKVCAAPPTHPETAAAWLQGLLDRGRLESFGAVRLAKVRQKLAENALDWLAALANSRDLGRVLGVTA